MLTNTLFDTHPVVIHAQGPHTHKVHWQPIKQWFYASPKREVGPLRDTTVITCNNGHEAMGALEESLAHLGVPVRVHGQGVDPWVNSRDKPRVLHAALQEIPTKYTLYIDSRDAIVIDDPHRIVDGFELDFDCAMLFGADRLNWPNVKRFKEFEERVADEGSEFRYLNGGIWIAETAFAREVFVRACELPVVPEAPESEQGMLKQLFMDLYPRIRLDTRCRLFQNIGYVVTPIFTLNGKTAKAVD